MTTDVVRVDDVHDGVRVVTLERPPANALDESLLTGLDSALISADRDASVRAVVLAGAGRFFSAGFDLKAERRSVDAVEAMVDLYKRTNRRLFAFPKPTVALVEGHFTAGGFVLAMACDIRVIAEGDATFGLNEVAIGASFPTVAMEIVRARLAPAAVTELVLGAQLHPLGDAVRLGLTDRLPPAPDARRLALEIAARMGRSPREVFAHTKAALVADALARIDAVSFDDELAIAALWSAPESRAARLAQVSKLKSGGGA
jgi:enoyl-CoA hydratase